MTLYDALWRLMLLYDALWRFLTLHDASWHFMTLHDPYLTLLMFHDASWRFMALYGALWRFVMLHLLNCDYWIQGSNKTVINNTRHLKWFSRWSSPWFHQKEFQIQKARQYVNQCCVWYSEWWERLRLIGMIDIVLFWFLIYELMSEEWRNGHFYFFSRFHNWKLSH